jgi:copper chaperone CopZ
MTCESCARTVERAIAEVDGVVDVKVSVSEGVAVMSLSQAARSDPRFLNEIQRAVTGAGYQYLECDTA